MSQFLQKKYSEPSPFSNFTVKTPSPEVECIVCFEEVCDTRTCCCFKPIHYECFVKASRASNQLSGTSDSPCPNCRMTFSERWAKLYKKPS